jgi:hypothetical protein
MLQVLNMLEAYDIKAYGPEFGRQNFISSPKRRVVHFAGSRGIHG